MAKIVKGKYVYNKNTQADIFHAKDERKVRKFVDSEDKNIIHGSNISAYRNDFDKKKYKNS